MRSCRRNRNVNRSDCHSWLGSARSKCCTRGSRRTRRRHLRGLTALPRAARVARSWPKSRSPGTFASHRGCDGSPPVAVLGARPGSLRAPLTSCAVAVASAPPSLPTPPHRLPGTPSPTRSRWCKARPDPAPPGTCSVLLPTLSVPAPSVPALATPLASHAARRMFCPATLLWIACSLACSFAVLCQRIGTTSARQLRHHQIAQRVVRGTSDRSACQAPLRRKTNVVRPSTHPFPVPCQWSNEAPLTRKAKNEVGDSQVSKKIVACCRLEERDASVPRAGTARGTDACNSLLPLKRRCMRRRVENT